MFDLSGRVAAVTGAGRGIGRGVAETLSRQGAAVIVNDLSPETAQSTAASIREQGGRAVACAFDVTDYAACESGLARGAADLGPIDILVNNAGGSPGGRFPEPFLTAPREEWPDWMGMNLTGVINCSHVVAAGMVERGYGRLIEISSDAARTGNVGSAIYGAAKAGGEGLMRTLSKELGPSGVTANSIVLGLIDTVPEEYLAGRDLGKLYWMRRIGTADDVAAGVVYLASEEAGWVTGHSLVINGGGTGG